MAYWDDEDEFDDEDYDEDYYDDDDDDWSEFGSNFEQGDAYIDDDSDEDKDKRSTDDGEGDGWGEDTKDGYGEESKSFGQAEEDEDFEDKKGKKENKKDDSEDEDKESFLDKVKEAKKEIEERKVFVYNAKKYGFPTFLPVVELCPECEKNSLFYDNYSKQLLRAITASSVGVPGRNSIIRYVCLNPKCKAFYPKKGIKFSYSSGWVQHKNIFHVIK